MCYDYILRIQRQAITQYFKKKSLNKSAQYALTPYKDNYILSTVCCCFIIPKDYLLINPALFKAEFNELTLNNIFDDSNNEILDTCTLIKDNNFVYRKYINDKTETIILSSLVETFEDKHYNIRLTQPKNRNVYAPVLVHYDDLLIGAVMPTKLYK